MKNGPGMEWDGPDMTTVAAGAFAGNRGLEWIPPRDQGVCDGMEQVERCWPRYDGLRRLGLRSARPPAIVATSTGGAASGTLALDAREPALTRISAR
ncbi:MAG TPA: hypothetical protein VEL07_15025 [Planctomycetota bacterium]|nr:hypothetical protein [Planctomycetota bacterium]